MLPIPVAAAPAALLQYKGHPDTISIRSPEPPDKLRTKETVLALPGRNQAWFTFPGLVPLFGKQARPQSSGSYACCCSRALRQANSDTSLLRSHVQASAKSSSEHDWRAGLQKVLPCPDQQQDGVCRFPTGHRRQLFSECKSSECRGWDRANLCQVPGPCSPRRALSCLPSLSSLSIHLHWLMPLSMSILHTPSSACPTTNL